MRRARFIVTLTIIIAAAGDARAQKHILDIDTGALTKGFRGTVTQCPGRVTRRQHFRFDRGWIIITDGRGRAVSRRKITKGGDGLQWVVELRGTIVVGTDMHGARKRAGAVGDTILGIDAKTGALRWRRAMQTYFATDLSATKIAAGAVGEQVILDVRTGGIVDRIKTTAASYPVRVCRNLAGAHYVKTPQQLIKVDASSSKYEWIVPTTTRQSPTVVGRYLVDSWLTARDFEIVAYDRKTGRELHRRRIQPVFGRDYIRIDLAPLGTHRVAIDAAFGIE